MSAADKTLVKKDRVITMTSIAEDIELFRWAGINFGESDSYKLQHSIKVN
jgi:hypothetical protein